MTDDPWTPFTVPPGGEAGAPAPTPWSAVPPVPTSGPPAMPPLGPPYTQRVDQPPPPRFPATPPEYWPEPPALLPTAPALVPRTRTPWLEDPRHRALTWGAIAIVFAIIVGALVGASVADGPGNVAASTAPTSQASTDSSSTESDTTTTTEPPSLASIVIDIERFVERERGLTFKRPVAVSLADESEFQRALLADFDKQSSALIEAQQVLRALGLVPPDFDLVAEERSFLSVAVGGFYDTETKQLVVRAAKITPLTREILAHELTHALDDQYFDLNRPQLDNTDDESGYGFSALVEGNARRVEDAYLASMSTADQVQTFNEQAELLAQHPELLDLPPIILSLAQSPYDDGERFVQDILDVGGQTQLDSAFGAPPLTSEQILDSARYLAGEGPAVVPVPKADGSASNTGVLGELLLRETLFDSLPSTSQVQRAIDGWGGDSYVTWTDASGKSCLRDTFVGDTQGDTNELVQAITDWGADHIVVIDAPAEGPATFTVCA